MENLGSFKSSLLVSAVALSLLSSPANAISEEIVRDYWNKNAPSLKRVDTEALSRLTALNDAQWAQFQSTAQSLMTPNMSEENRTSVIKALSKVDAAKLFHEKFLATAQSFMTPSMCAYDRAQLIESLGKVPAEILSQDNFVTIAKSLMTEDMNQDNSAIAINTLGMVAPAEWDRFVTTAKSLMTQDMIGDDRTFVIGALSEMDAEKLFDEKFLATAQSFGTESMDGKNRAEVIRALGEVPTDKIERVYGQIQRLMQSTQGKIDLTEDRAAIPLIVKLRDAKTDEMAQTFTTVLIAGVNGTQKEVTDKLFLEKMASAWKQVQDAAKDQLDELARRGTSHPQRLEPDDSALTQPRGLGSRKAKKDDN